MPSLLRIPWISRGWTPAQWLRLHTSHTGGLSSSPDEGTGPHMLCGAAKRKKSHLFDPFGQNPQIAGTNATGLLTDNPYKS